LKSAISKQIEGWTATVKRYESDPEATRGSPYVEASIPDRGNVVSSQGIPGGRGIASERGAMPLLRYLVTVGAVLTLGLVWLSAYLEPTSTDAAARVSVSPTTASVLHAGAAHQPK
jgi:hypothetical protein